MIDMKILTDDSLKCPMCDTLGVAGPCRKHKADPFDGVTDDPLRHPLDKDDALSHCEILRKYDYEFTTMNGERRIDVLLHSIWEEYGRTGKAISRQYVSAATFEFTLEAGK